MNQPVLLAIDQGTTSSRAILFSKDGKILSVRQKELTLHCPQKGWVEQNPEDIWADTLWACRGVLEGAPPLAGIGVTNQRETTIVWDRKTGEPVYNAIVWQDRRTADFCAALKKKGYEKKISKKTGLLIDPYFSATKISWILENVKGARKKAEAGDLIFGTVDTFLLWRLTGGKVHATDATNASRTMLFNIVKHEWDKELLGLFDIPESMLPDVKDNAAAYGYTAANWFGKCYVIGGMAGDQQAALIGQACFSEGMVKSTYGTGCFALMNIGSTFKPSKHHLLTTIGYRLNGKTIYAVEGAIFVAGAAIQWLRDGLKLFPNAADSEALALSVPDSNGIHFVPAFTGLGAPYWDPHARAAIMGLTRESTGAHITRAALEAQAFQTLDLMEAMMADSGHNPAVIRADGGLVANKFVCQFIADMLGKPVEVPRVSETTALGAAYLAGLQTGIYDGLKDITKAWSCSHRYNPQLKPAERKALHAGWKEAVGRVLSS